MNIYISKTIVLFRLDHFQFKVENFIGLLGFVLVWTVLTIWSISYWIDGWSDRFEDLGMNIQVMKKSSSFVQGSYFVNRKLSLK